MFPLQLPRNNHQDNFEHRNQNPRDAAGTAPEAPGLQQAVCPTPTGLGGAEGPTSQQTFHLHDLQQAGQPVMGPGCLPPLPEIDGDKQAFPSRTRGSVAEEHRTQAVAQEAVGAVLGRLIHQESDLIKRAFQKDGKRQQQHSDQHGAFLWHPLPS